MLQEYGGTLSFGTDAWMSLNHCSYISVTVHLEENGVPILLLLDLVELAKSHSGANLAAAFTNILDEFGISDKILSVTCDNASANDYLGSEVLYKCRAHDSEISGDRVYGYLVLESDLMEYAKFIGADQGNDDDDISLAAAHLLVRANLGKGKLTGATHPTSGKFYK
ncbi:hypothetical protein H0H93_005657 [Arthromyces matolae]|nr:hypothetical protein H0H93_005657 [Arthromyces matolae]